MHPVFTVTGTARVAKSTRSNQFLAQRLAKTNFELPPSYMSYSERISPLWNATCYR
jgi:hypothetical protein